jgi:hypothetical protein
MGGGAAMMFAGWMADSEPDLLKAAVLVAPWNFARKPEILPSDAVAKLTAPTMVLCSTTDQMAPCEGYAFSSYTPILIQGLVEIGLPIIFGGNQTYLDTSVLDPEFGRNFAWFGGVTAMFENSTHAINIQIPGVDHLTVAAANNGSEARCTTAGAPPSGRAISLLCPTACCESTPPWCIPPSLTGRWAEERGASEGWEAGLWSFSATGCAAPRIFTASC